MTQAEPVADAVEDDVSEEESDDCSLHEPGMNNEKDYEMQCRGEARDFLKRRRHMSEEEAKRFVKETVTWNVKSASWEDAGEARSVEASVTLNFGKAPVTATLEYHFRARYSSVEHFCKLMWDGSGSNTSILQKTAFKLKATHVKAAREASFPDGWPESEVMEFIYTCVGAGGPCQAAESKKGLSSDTVAVCKALDKPAAAKKQPAAKKATGVKGGGVAKGKAAAGKAKRAGNNENSALA